MKKKHETKLKSHIRENESLTANWEKKILLWLAERMPAWITPDILTTIGFIAAIMIFVSYLLSNYHPAFLWLASLGFIINWFGDSLDGTLARYRHIERPKFGYYVDHTIDAIGETLIICGLGISPYVSLNVALIALIGYFLLSIQTFICTYVVGVFKISYSKMGPTEVRIILILINTIMFFSEINSIRILSLNITYFDMILIISTFIMVIFYITQSIKIASDLLKSGE